MVNVVTHEEYGPDRERTFNDLAEIQRRLDAMPTTESIQQQLTGYATSQDIQIILAAFDSLRDELRLRVKHAGQAAAQGTVPSVGDMDEIRDQFADLSRYDEMLASLDERVTKVERTTEHHAGRLDDQSEIITKLRQEVVKAQTEAAEAKRLAEAANTNLGKFSDRVTDVEAGVREVKDKTAQIEGWQTNIYTVLGMNDEGTESRTLKIMQDTIDSVVGNVADLRRKLDFSIMPVFVLAVIGAVVFGLFGALMSHWVIGGIVGLVVGGLIGLALASRGKKAKKNRDRGDRPDSARRGGGRPASPTPAAPAAPVSSSAPTH